MTNKTLVAYHTKSGASEKYARIIVETLAEQGFQADLVNLKEEIPDVASYDCIVVGTGVRMAMVYRRWRKVLKQKLLKDRRLFIYLSSGTAIKDPEQAVDKFIKPIVDKYNLKPISVVSFPGIIPGKWAKTNADKDSIKPEKAKAWAHEIADRLKSNQ